MTGADGGSPMAGRFRDGHVVSPGQGSSPSFQECVALARTGDFDALFACMGGDNEDLDELAYKLLWVAADSGHDEADDLIDDLLETSSLRYDDDQFVQGNAHFELGLAYLTGSDGLPPDPEKGRAHLEEAHTSHWPWGVQGGEALLSEARAILSASQRAVFDEVYRPG